MYIASNLANGIAAHIHTGFVFDAGIRDAQENRGIPNFNGFIPAMIPPHAHGREAVVPICPAARTSFRKECRNVNRTNADG